MIKDPYWKVHHDSTGEKKKKKSWTHNIYHLDIKLIASLAEMH